MSTREKSEADRFPTGATLERSLPDLINELKGLTAELTAETAVFEHDCDLVKKDEGIVPGKLSNQHKTKIVEELRSRFCLGAAAAIQASAQQLPLQLRRASAPSQACKTAS